MQSCIHKRRFLSVECLEAREVVATFFVTTTADSGGGSLRDAIIQANDLPGKDLITFDFQSPQLAPARVGVVNIQTEFDEPPPIVGDTDIVTIKPITRLPTITEAVTIDGTLEGFGLTGPVPGIELRGSLLQGTNSVLRLDNADGSEIYGLIINSASIGINAIRTDDFVAEDTYVGIYFDETDGRPVNNVIFLRNFGE